MPKPVYILCADNVSIDKATNLVSVFSILERIHVEKGPSDPKRMPNMPLRLKSIAVWRREESDPAVFDIATSLLISGKEVTSLRGTLKFEDGKPLARTIADLVLMPPDDQRGSIAVRQCLINPSTGDSVSQEYVIDTEFVDRTEERSDLAPDLAPRAAT
jgi:hypothetical protein